MTWNGRSATRKAQVKPFIREKGKIVEIVAFSRGVDSSTLAAVNLALAVVLLVDMLVFFMS
jgi:PP-loop superfamily ATP-utilizing enzyme